MSAPPDDAEGVQSPRRTLVVAPRRLARLLLHRSAFLSLADTGRLSAVMCSADHAPVLEPMLLRSRLEHHPDLLGAVPLVVHRESADAESLRAFAFDDAVLLEPRWADAHLLTAAGVGRRIGFRRGLAGLWCNVRVTVEPRKEGLPADGEAKVLMEAAGVPWRTGPLPTPELWQKVGRERLEKAKLDPDGAPLVAVYLGTEGSLGGGAWPTKLMEELLRRIRRDHPSWQLLILTPDADLWQSVLLYERTGKIHPVIGPDLTLDGLAALLSRIHLLVAADSWLLQLAAAVGTPTVGLFERDARRHAPRGPGHLHLEMRPLRKLEVEIVLEEVGRAVSTETRAPAKGEE